MNWAVGVGNSSPPPADGFRLGEEGCGGGAAVRARGEAALETEDIRRRGRGIGRRPLVAEDGGCAGLEAPPYKNKPNYICKLVPEQHNEKTLAYPELWFLFWICGVAIANFAIL